MTLIAVDVEVSCALPAAKCQPGTATLRPLSNQPNGQWR